MQYAPDKLTPRERYKLLAGFVLPRPTAWVTTVGATGVVNAAPFSFFNVFCEDPPLCMFAVNLRPDGRVKDTLVNIRRSGEFGRLLENASRRATCRALRRGARRRSRPASCAVAR